MTIGDEVRRINKEFLTKEIKNLQDNVKTILNNDGDASEEDSDIKVYRLLIAQKKAELEIL